MEEWGSGIIVDKVRDIDIQTWENMCECVWSVYY